MVVVVGVSYSIIEILAMRKEKEEYKKRITVQSFTSH